MKRFVFNPQHDLSLADGGESFIPPASVVEFAKRCRWIERFMERPSGYGDPVACGEAGFGSAVSEIVPWGWNRNLREQLLREGYLQELLPADTQLDFIKEHSRRELAVELLGYIDDEFNVMGSPMEGGGIISPYYRIVAHSIKEIEEFLQSKGRVVLKAPLSGSGKGIRFCTGELMETDRGWCRRVLQRQGAVIVEERMDVLQEFAMLFECCGEVANGEPSVRFIGYSLFYAKNGAYGGNLLASNEFIENELGKLVPVGTLLRVRVLVERFLQEKLQGQYNGYIGVDQFIYAEDCGHFLNPAVEINLRMTMGLIARNIYDFHAQEYLLGDGTHYFEPEKGVFLCNRQPEQI